LLEQRLYRLSFFVGMNGESDESIWSHGSGFCVTSVNGLDI
jgi:hypothetical protein